MALDIFGLTSIDDATRREIIRKELHNLTTSYSDEADVFTELIQNAVDAIDLRSGEDDDASGQLEVVIGRRSSNAHYVYVQDNGTGMTAEVVDKVFIPNFSFGKKQGHSLGYKGVGLSYVLAVSDHIAIKTVQDGLETTRTVLHTNAWVVDSEKPEPEVLDDFKAPPEIVKQVAEALNGHGTGVYYEFHTGSKPADLNGLVRIGDGPDKEILYWAGLLSARTPIGLAISEHAPIANPIQVRIVLDLGDGSVHEREFERSRFDLNKKALGYPYPESVVKIGINTEAIDSTPDNQRHNKHYRKHQAVFHEWDAAEFIDEVDFDDDERSMLASHLLWVRGYLCYSTDVMEVVRQELGTKKQVVKYGARLAVDGAPQGRSLPLALTSDQGLDRQTHIVLGFSELGLDTGRKFVSDERLLSAINKVTQRVVTWLKEYRRYLKVKALAEIASDLEAWRNEVAARSGLSTVPKLFTALNLKTPSLVDPENEQEVIALWTALLTAGALPGFQMKAISGFNRYDALVDIKADALSNTGNLKVITTDRKPKADAVLEFKLMFDDLIADFEKKTKLPYEIDLIVCWDLPSTLQRLGSLAPTYGTWADERDIRGQSYTWTDDTGNVSLPVIALRNAIAELSVANGVAVGQQHLEILENRDETAFI